jgi:hypothetical protein
VFALFRPYFLKMCGTCGMHMALRVISTHCVAGGIVWAFGTSTCHKGQGSRIPVDVSRITCKIPSLSSDLSSVAIVANLARINLVWVIEGRQALRHTGTWTGKVGNESDKSSANKQSGSKRSM